MRLRALITAAEGMAALERLVASASSEILLCLTEAAPETPLAEPRLRERGLETWSDLIAWTARRDVAVRIMFCEPDPLMSPAAYRLAWMQASGFANVVSSDSQIICAPHGQKLGPLRRSLMRRRLSRAMAALRAAEPGQRTPVQRQILSLGAVVRVAQMQQSFAVADGKTALLGAFALEGEAEPPRPAEPRVMLSDDSDFAAALRGHFTQSWNDALGAGAQSLASRAAVFDTRVRAQSRPDLRLLRTLAAPAPGALRILPEPMVTDLARTLPKALSEAQRYVYIETPVLPDMRLVEALANTVVPASDLQRGFGDRMALVRPSATRICGTVVIVDDALAVLGAFGLSPRSLNTDKGAAVGFQAENRITSLMTRLGQRWTGESDPARLRQAACWQQAAEQESGAVVSHFPSKAMVKPPVFSRLPDAFF